MENKTIPFKDRPLDMVIVAFFLINLLFITYVIDLEQLVIPYAAHFTYPIWPPRPIVDLVQSYGHLYDHDLLARPVWWKMTIWIDDLLFGPFYVVAIYAYVKGKNWIRMPSVIYASMLMTNVIIILGEEYAGQWAAPNFLMVLASNLPWLVFPLIIISRMWRAERPFSQPASRTPATLVETGAGAQMPVPAQPDWMESVESGQ
ncbi:MAG: EXPERA domain-containing protein [Ktedonobacterales bacterium]